MKVGDLITHKGELHLVVKIQLKEYSFMPKEWMYTLTNIKTLQTFEIAETYIRR